jgi:hypothetical protein
MNRVFSLALTLSTGLVIAGCTGTNIAVTVLLIVTVLVGWAFWIGHQSGPADALAPVVTSAATETAPAREPAEEVAESASSEALEAQVEVAVEPEEPPTPTSARSEIGNRLAAKGILPPSVAARLKQKSEEEGD